MIFYINKLKTVSKFQNSSKKLGKLLTLFFF